MGTWFRYRDTAERYRLAMLGADARDLFEMVPLIVDRRQVDRRQG